MTAELAGLRLSVADAWDKAEHAIKLAEQVNGQVVNPAIYELRYAGRRLIEAYHLEASGDLTKCADLLRDAQMDCMRARHDAIDAATSKVTVHLELAVQNLGAGRVLSCFPNWADTYQHLSAVREKIAVSRGARNDRAAIYEAIESADLPKIIKLYNEFKAQEPRLMSEAKIGRLKEAGGWIFSGALFIVGLALEFLGII